jgi:hypothetical protein
LLYTAYRISTDSVELNKTVPPVHFVVNKNRLRDRKTMALIYVGICFTVRQAGAPRQVSSFEPLDSLLFVVD